jgi:hypothetical protein
VLYSLVRLRLYTVNCFFHRVHGIEANRYYAYEIRHTRVYFLAFSFAAHKAPRIWSASAIVIDIRR